MFALALHDLAAFQFGPSSARKVDWSCDGARQVDGGDHDAGSQHELVIHCVGCGVARKVVHHRAHDGRPILRALAQQRVHVGQQAVAELDVLATYGRVGLPQSIRLLGH